MSSHRGSFDVPPNMLAGQSAPNTLGGVGLPVRGNALRRPWIPMIGLTGVVLAVLASVLLLWRPA